MAWRGSDRWLLIQWCLIGCWTCRFRKKKCDEGTPICNSCKTLHIFCESMEKDQPLYMRDAEAASRKKKEIKSQMGKCKRKRRRKIPKPPAEFPVQRSPIELSVMPTEHPRSSDTLMGDSPMTMCSMSTPRTLLPSPSPPGQGIDWRLPEEKVGNAKLPFVTIEKRSNQKKLSRIEILVQTSENLPNWAYKCTPKSDFSSFETIPDTEINKDVQIEKFLQAEFNSTGPSQISPSDAQIYISELGLKNFRELKLIQHYIYDVCSYTYKGMPKDSLDQLMQQALVPRCRAKEAFRQGCLSSGVLHLMAVTGQRSLEVDAIQYRGNSLTGLRNILKNPNFYYSEDMLGIILIIATFDV